MQSEALAYDERYSATANIYQPFYSGGAHDE